MKELLYFLEYSDFSKNVLKIHFNTPISNAQKTQILNNLCIDYVDLSQSKESSSSVSIVKGQLFTWKEVLSVISPILKLNTMRRTYVLDEYAGRI